MTAEGSLGAASAPLPSCPPHLPPPRRFLLPQGRGCPLGKRPGGGSPGGGAWSHCPEPTLTTVRSTAHPVEGQFRRLDDSRWKLEPQFLLGVLWGSGPGTCAHKVPPNTPRLSGGPCTPGRPGPLPSVLTPAAHPRVPAQPARCTGSPAAPLPSKAVQPHRQGQGRCRACRAGDRSS